MKDQHRDKAHNLSPQTLALASVSSGAAAIISSQLWESGTAPAAALTPVLVALLSEALRRPAEKISQVQPVRRLAAAPAQVAGAARSAQAGRTAAAGATADRSPAGGDHRPDRGDPGAPTAVAEPPEPAGHGRRNGEGALAPARETSVVDPSGRPEYRRVYGGRRRRSFRLAALTGVVAFLIAAAALTLPELLLGGAVTGDRTTTFFGGPPPASSESDRPGTETGGGEEDRPDRPEADREEDKSKRSPDEQRPAAGDPERPAVRASPPSGQSSPSAPQGQSLQRSAPQSSSGGGSPGAQPGGSGGAQQSTPQQSPSR